MRGFRAAAAAAAASNVRRAECGRYFEAERAHAAPRHGPAARAAREARGLSPLQPRSLRSRTCDANAMKSCTMYKITYVTKKKQVPQP